MTWSSSDRLTRFSSHLIVISGLFCTMLFSPAVSVDVSASKYVVSLCAAEVSRARYECFEYLLGPDYVPRMLRSRRDDVSIGLEGVRTRVPPTLTIAWMTTRPRMTDAPQLEGFLLPTGVSHATWWMGRARKALRWWSGSAASAWRARERQSRRDGPIKWRLGKMLSGAIAKRPLTASRYLGSSLGGPS